MIFEQVEATHKRRHPKASSEELDEFSKSLKSWVCMLVRPPRLLLLTNVSAYCSPMSLP